MRDWADTLTFLAGSLGVRAARHRAVDRASEVARSDTGGDEAHLTVRLTAPDVALCAVVPTHQTTAALIRPFEAPPRRTARRLPRRPQDDAGTPGVVSRSSHSPRRCRSAGERTSGASESTA